MHPALLCFFIAVDMAGLSRALVDHVFKHHPFQIVIDDEGRDMWQVYLDVKDYAAALEHCRDTFQRDHIFAAQVIISVVLCII